MKKLRILVLMHPEATPPDDLKGVSPKALEDFKTEYDVVSTLRWMGHAVEKLAVSDELAPIRTAIGEFKPHLAFNLLEGFRGLVAYDQHVVSYLELIRMPYTGCNPRGLTLARDKGLSKKILAYHRIRVPEFFVSPLGRKIRRPKNLKFPLIVKSLIEDASFGIAQASIVHTDDRFKERVQFVHEHIGTDAIAEEFIEGRELYVPIVGNVRLQVLPVWEMIATNLPTDEPLIATAKAKFDLDYQKRHGITHDRAQNLNPETERRLTNTSKRIYRILGLSGYARMDFRLDAEERFYFLEANPNPEIAEDEELACAAVAVGIPYEKLLQRLITLGLRRAAHR